MATHSNVLAWRIPGKGEPGGLPSIGSHRVGHDRSDLAAAAAADYVHVHAQSLQSYLTLCDPMDSSLPGSSVHEILQAIILECPACRGTLGGRRKAVRDRLALQGGTGDFP